MSSTLWRRLAALSLISAVVPSLVALALIWLGPGWVEDSAALRWTLTVLVLLAGLGLGLHVRERLSERLRTYGNILSAIREGDFTVRATRVRGDDPFSEIASELNSLSTQLRDERLSRKETDALLGKILEEIDAGVFALDHHGRLRLVNRRGARWLGRRPAELIGLSARVVGLGACLEGETPRVMEMVFPGGTGRYELRRTTFRESGRPHQLLVLTDLSRALAAEERLAWRRLIQVLRHEINNSLTPIRSLATTLRDQLDKRPRPPSFESDLADGLDVVIARSQSLGRLMAAYARLTRLPPPEVRPVSVREWIGRGVASEDRLAVHAESGPDITLQADPDQLDQVLINLVRNAVDAALETGGGVALSWRRVGIEPGYVSVFVDDEGPGLSGSENLFVPFFTTKPGGSGIGLALSKQIVEAHGGRLRLDDRPGGRGCRVTLTLPVGGPPAID